MECENYVDLGDTMSDLAGAIDDAINGFSDEVPNQPQPTQEEAKEAGEFLNAFKNFIGSSNFKDKVNATAQKYNVPPKKVAENFFEKALGMIGDILGIAIATVGNAAHTLVNIISQIAHAGINLIVSVANGLAGIISGNKTCVA